MVLYHADMYVCVSGCMVPGIMYSEYGYAKTHTYSIIPSQSVPFTVG